MRLRLPSLPLATPALASRLLRIHQALKNPGAAEWH
jgi:hypothetical protein